MSSRKRSFRRRQKPPFAERAKDHCRKFTAFLFSNVGIILLVVLYTIAGAFMFIAIEGQERDEEEKNVLLKNRLEFVDKLFNISLQYNTFDEMISKEKIDEVIFEFQNKAVELFDLGYGEETEKKWSFSGAFLYSLTVITTIGYGNIAPRTILGKISTILYAIIGMPLFLLYLSNIGDILAKSFKWTYAKLCLCRICPGLARKRVLRERRKTRALTVERDLDTFSQKRMEMGFSNHPANEYDNDDDDDDTIENDFDVDAELQADTHTVIVPLTTCVFIMIGYIFFGALLFTRWEDTWGLLNGSYFCFISLSSIGFGDLVPGDKVVQSSSSNIVELSFILCAVYLLLGMALIAMCFNLMQEQVIHKMRSFKRILRRCCGCDRNGRVDR